MTNTSESAQTLPTPADDSQELTPPDVRDPIVETVVRQYALTMLWANGCCGTEWCEDGRNGDCEHTNRAHDRYDFDDFSANDQTAMIADVYDIIVSNYADFLAYCDKRSAEDFGHDFALTRNGHGAGFWDRGLGELGDRLTAMAKPYGESSVDVSEDGVALS